jgi:hypothetical protein
MTDSTGLVPFDGEILVEENRLAKLFDGTQVGRE